MEDYTKTQTKEVRYRNIPLPVGKVPRNLGFAKAYIDNVVPKLYSVFRTRNLNKIRLVARKIAYSDVDLVARASEEPDASYLEGILRMKPPTAKRLGKILVKNYHVHFKEAK